MNYKTKAILNEEKRMVISSNDIAKDLGLDNEWLRRLIDEEVWTQFVDGVEVTDEYDYYLLDEIGFKLLARKCRMPEEFKNYCLEELGDNDKTYIEALEDEVKYTKHIIYDLKSDKSNIKDKCLYLVNLLEQPELVTLGRIANEYNVSIIEMVRVLVECEFLSYAEDGTLTIHEKYEEDNENGELVIFDRYMSVFTVLDKKWVTEPSFTRKARLAIRDLLIDNDYSMGYGDLHREYDELIEENLAFVTDESECKQVDFSEDFDHYEAPDLKYA